MKVLRAIFLHVILSVVCSRAVFCAGCRLAGCNAGGLVQLSRQNIARWRIYIALAVFQLSLKTFFSGGACVRPSRRRPSASSSVERACVGAFGPSFALARGAKFFFFFFSPVALASAIIIVYNGFYSPLSQTLV